MVVTLHINLAQSLRRILPCDGPYGRAQSNTHTQHGSSERGTMGPATSTGLISRLVSSDQTLSNPADSIDLQKPQDT